MHFTGPYYINGDGHCASALFWSWAVIGIAVQSFLLRSVYDGDVSKMTVAFGYLIYHVGLMGLHAPLRLVGGRDKLRNRPLPNLVAGFGVHGLFALQFMRYLTANNYWSVVHKLVF